MFLMPFVSFFERKRSVQVFCIVCIAVGNPIIKRKIEITLTSITRYIVASIPSQYLLVPSADVVVSFV
jgi:hypothetical protein